jgi:23S rRNA (adenine2503-C2)-methyltransferase
MPISRTNPLPELKKALLEYQGRRKKRITFEYVLLKGINDRKEDINLLSAYMKGLKGVVNIIPYNIVENTDFISPGKEDVSRFISWLEDASIPVVQRYRRGRGINGACGQLGAIS